MAVTRLKSIQIWLMCAVLVLGCVGCAWHGPHGDDPLLSEVIAEPDPGLELPWEMLPGWGGHFWHLGHFGRHNAVEAQPEVAPLTVQNPMFIPYGDREFIWNQIVDSVDDYFEISREQRVQQTDGVLIEGRIETQPQPGATLLEQWRLDSMPGFERRHATFQSIRRRALLRVIPKSAGYLLDLQVQKELEDVDHVDLAMPGAVTPRHDRSLVRTGNFNEPGATTLGWIAAGRDFALEQEMLSEIRSRLFEEGSNALINPGPPPQNAP